MLTLTSEEKTGQKTPLCKTPVSDLLNLAAQYLPPESLPAMPTTAHTTDSIHSTDEDPGALPDVDNLSVGGDEPGVRGEGEGGEVSVQVPVGYTTGPAQDTDTPTHPTYPEGRGEGVRTGSPLTLPPSTTRLAHPLGEGHPFPTVPADWVQDTESRDASLGMSPVNSPGEGPVQSTPHKPSPAAFCLPQAAPARAVASLAEDTASSTSSPSPTRRLGTPRRSRLAAKFSTPMSPATSEASNN